MDFGGGIVSATGRVPAGISALQDADPADAIDLHSLRLVCPDDSDCYATDDGRCGVCFGRGGVTFTAPGVEIEAPSLAALESMLRPEWIRGLL